MRILELRFKNLNSLKGEWHIDFSDAAFVNEGIFAITGATGAGKTTILDAICLALYAETPRITSISKSTNEVMTRQTGDCYAEVVIDLNGTCYRCRWGQRRAYNKPDGNLQDATHEVALVKNYGHHGSIDNNDHNPDATAKNTTGDEILESKLSRTKDKIVELTSMDFQQFTRSILLAQGSFAAFLSAKADERADILEKITGTDIYATISERVHHKKRQEEETLTALTAKLDGLALLSTEEESQLKKQVADLNSSQQQQRHKLTTISEQINWLEEVQQLKQQRLDYQQRTQQANLAIQAFAPDAQRLVAANKALELESLYHQLITQRQNVARINTEKQALQDTRPSLAQAIADNEKKLAQLNAEILTANENLQRQLPIIAKVRKQDSDIQHQRHSLSEQKQQLTELQLNIQQLQHALSDKQQTQQQTKTQLDEAIAYINSHQHHESLSIDIENFDGFGRQLKQHLQSITELTVKKEHNHSSAA